MEKRTYYAERVGAITPAPFDLTVLKKKFMLLFEDLERKYYFNEAAGSQCVQMGFIPGVWGEDIEGFIYLSLTMDDVWPIKKTLSKI